MVEITPPLPGLSPVNGKALTARFDGGALSSDAGLLALREVERRLDVAGRLAACIDDPRDPTRTVHSVADILRFRMLMIVSGYEDGIDANALRADPVFKMALERLPGERDLCSQSTVSRLENLPDRRMLLRMGRAMVGLYCASFAQVPRRITLDIDDTFDPVHGGQQLRLFNAHYDNYGFQPIVVVDGAGRFVAAVLRPAKRPKGCEIAAHLRRLVREIRSHWPRVEILIRGDGHSCAPEVLDICRAHGVDFILGLPATRTLRRHVAALEAATTARAEAAGGKLRRFKEFHDGAASWSRVERLIARVEAGPQGCDTRFIVTSLAIGTGKTLYRGRLLRPRSGREPHQGVEGAPRRRPHLLHQRRRQPAAPVSPCRRLLADVDAARRSAETIALAARPVRHPPPAPHQDRRPRRRDEEPDHTAPAERMPGRADHASPARTAAAHDADLMARTD
jgi:hypothetical protein